MKLANLFKKTTKQPQKTGEFASFFLHASDKEKIDVIRKAAQGANQDQRELYVRAQLQLKTQE